MKNKFPVVTYTNDGEWELVEPFLCQWIDPWNGVVRGVLVPEGFRTNLASVPRIFWMLIAPFDLSLAAPIVHDYLYQKNGDVPPGYKQRHADWLFLRIMRNQGISFYRRWPAYIMVRIFARRWRLSRVGNWMRWIILAALIGLLIWWLV